MTPLSALLASALASAAPAVVESSDGALSLETPFGWIAEDPLPADDAGSAVLAVEDARATPSPTFRAFPLGAAMSAEELKRFAESRAQALADWGHEPTSVRSFQPPAGGVVYYYEVDQAAGHLLEGACTVGPSSYWLRARHFRDPVFRSLVSTLRPGNAPAASPSKAPRPAVPEVSKRPAEPPEREGVIREFRVGADAPAEPPKTKPVVGPAPEKREPVGVIREFRVDGSGPFVTHDRVAVSGKWLSVVVPDGYRPVPGGTPHSVIALQSEDGAIELFRLPPEERRLRLTYYVMRRIASISGWRELARRRFAVASRSPNGERWSWGEGGSEAGHWIAGEIGWSQGKYWFLAAGRATQAAALRELLSSFGLPDAPSGAPEYDEAPGGRSLPGPSRGALAGAGAMFAALLAWGLFILPVKPSREWADEYKSPDLLATRHPSIKHPLRGTSIIWDGGFSAGRGRVLGPEGVRYRFEWPTPAKPAAAFTTPLIFFLWLGIVPPLGPDPFGVWAGPLLAATGAWCLVRMLWPNPKPCAYLMDAKGKLIARLFRAFGWTEETYRVSGIDKDALGYVFRDPVGQLRSKRWSVLDVGQEEVLLAEEPMGLSIARRFVGRLGGLLGATMILRESGTLLGDFKSSGFMARRFEVQFEPRRQSRALQSLDPRVLLALAVVILVRDPDREYPWPLA